MLFILGFIVVGIIFVLFCIGSISDEMEKQKVERMRKENIIMTNEKLKREREENNKGV